jgi:hypothetical protein
VCFIVCRTTSELERVILTTLYLAGTKTLTVGAPGRGFAACFSSGRSDGYFTKTLFVANDNNPTGIGLALGETICFGSLEFTTDRLGRLSLSPEDGDLGAIFIGMVHSGSPSLHTALKDSSNECGATSGAGGAPDPLAPRVQRGNFDSPYHRHTGVGEHSSTPDHLDGHGANLCTTTRYGAPP